MHDHDYFQFPTIGTSILYKAKVSRNQSKLHKPRDTDRQVRPIDSWIADDTPLISPQELRPVDPSADPIGSSITTVATINDSQQPESLTPAMKLLSEIFTHGIDAEDMHYFQAAYRKLVANQDERDRDRDRDRSGSVSAHIDSDLLTNPTSLIATLSWVEYPCTKVPPPAELEFIVASNLNRVTITDRPLSRKRLYDNCITDIIHRGGKKSAKKRRKLQSDSNFLEDPTDVVTIHSTGSARTQGYYQISNKEKRMGAHGTMLLGNSRNTRMPLVPATAAKYVLDRRSESTDTVFRFVYRITTVMILFINDLQMDI